MRIFMDEVIVRYSEYGEDDWYIHTDFSGEIRMKILHRLRSHPQERKGKKAVILYNVRITTNGFAISAEFMLAGDLTIGEVISPTARVLPYIFTHTGNGKLQTLYGEIPNQEEKEIGEDILKLFSLIKKEAQDFFDEISEEALEKQEPCFMGNMIVNKEVVPCLWQG